FEMKSGDRLGRTPVTTPQGVAPVDVQRGSDALSIPLRDHKQHVPGHRIREMLEELEGEIWRRVMFAIGAGIAAKEIAKVIAADGRTGFTAQGDIGFGKLAALLLDALALVVTHFGKEVVEVAVTCVGP